MDDRQLSWVHSNRQRYKSVFSLGELVTRIKERPGFRNGPDPVKIMAVLQAVLGPELAGHCRAGRLRSGTLTIQVDEPTLRYHLQSERKASVQKELAGIPGLQGLREVRFK